MELIAVVIKVYHLSTTCKILSSILPLRPHIFEIMWDQDCGFQNIKISATALVRISAFVRY
jgi:hypothetical protein